MKKIYVFILFLIFLNIFNIMFVAMQIFPESTYTEEGFPVNETANPQETEGIFERLSHGYQWYDVFNIFFGKVENPAGLALSLLILGGAVLAAWLTRSPAPFVLLFMVNIIKNIYIESQPVLQNYPINGYIMIASSIGFMVLFIITAAEYLTHGDV